MGYTIFPKDQKTLNPIHDYHLCFFVSDLEMIGVDGVFCAVYLCQQDTKGTKKEITFSSHCASYLRVT